MKYVYYFLSIILVTAATALVAEFWFIPIHYDIDMKGWDLAKAIGVWLLFWISIDIYVSAREQRHG